MARSEQKKLDREPLEKEPIRVSAFSELHENIDTTLVTVHSV